MRKQLTLSLLVLIAFGVNGAARADGEERPGGKGFVPLVSIGPASILVFTAATGGATLRSKKTSPKSVPSFLRALAATMMFKAV